MKFNWGTGIVLALAGFIAFIMFFFIKGHSVKQDDLVSQEYYDEGLQHDERSEWIKNAKDLEDDLVIEKVDGRVLVNIPSQLLTGDLSGKIKFLRPNNAKLDLEHVIEDGQVGAVVFAEGKFLQGSYRLKAKLEANGKSYYWDRNFSY